MIIEISGENELVFLIYSTVELPLSLHICQFKIKIASFVYIIGIDNKLCIRTFPLLLSMNNLGSIAIIMVTFHTT